MTISPRPRERRRRHVLRRGVSLIELLVSMVLLSVTIGSIALTLATCFRAERQLREQLEHGRPWQQLALTFRDDCHVASASNVTARSDAPLREVDEDEPAATLEMPGELVAEYFARPGHVERRLRKAGNLVHRDSFSLGANSLVSVALIDDAPRRLVLRWMPAATERPHALPRTVEAVLPAGADVRQPRRRRRRSLVRRQGSILVAALVCFLVVALLSAVAVDRVVQGHRETKRRQQQWQAEWLSHSAAERAVARLRSDPEYRGETWQLSELEFGTHANARPGVATIAVVPAEGNSSRVRVTVAARYPADETFGILRTQEFVFSLAAPGDSP